MCMHNLLSSYKRKKHLGMLEVFPMAGLRELTLWTNWQAMYTVAQHEFTLVTSPCVANFYIFMSAQKSCEILWNPPPAPMSHTCRLHSVGQVGVVVLSSPSCSTCEWPRFDSRPGALCGLGFQSLPDCEGFSRNNCSLGFSSRTETDMSFLVFSQFKSWHLRETSAK